MLNSLKKLIRILPKSDHLKLGFLLLAMIFGSMLEIIGIGVIPLFVSALTNPDMLLEHEWVGPWLAAAGVENAHDLLVYGSVLMIVAFTVKNSYLVVLQYLIARFVFNRFASIGSRLFKAYMNASYTFHLQRNSAALLRNVTQETQHMAQSFMIPSLKMLMNAVIIVGIFAFLMVLEPLITLLVLVVLGGGGGLFLQLIRKRIRRHGSRAQQERGNMIKDVNEGLGGVKDAKVLNRETWFTKRFSSHIKTLARTIVFRQTIRNSTKPVMETIAMVGMLLITLLLYWQGRGVDTVIPVLALFGAATVRLMPALQESISSWTQARYYSYSVNPIYDDMSVLIDVSGNKNKNKERKEVTTESEKLPFSQNIILDKVTYAYPGSDEEAIKDVSLEIPKGSSVGFVGESGSGKTTIVDLILGLLKPNRGVIKVDGTNIWNSISTWQRNIGYIPQFIYLTDDSIRKNIAFGLPDIKIDEKRLYKAIEASQLGPIINKLPEGDRTIIGEQGVRLSGGQRQRIGIARALYHNPQLLIMDEATSALDNKTEEHVIRAIEELKGERTIIMIAHRLTTVENCDILFMMENGRISKKGSYKYLAYNSKNFRELASE